MKHKIGKHGAVGWQTQHGLICAECKKPIGNMQSELENKKHKLSPFVCKKCKKNFFLCQCKAKENYKIGYRPNIKIKTIFIRKIKKEIPIEITFEEQLDRQIEKITKDLAKVPDGKTESHARAMRKYRKKLNPPAEEYW